MEGPFSFSRWLPVPLNLGRGKFARTSAQETEAVYFISAQSGRCILDLLRPLCSGPVSAEAQPRGWGGRRVRTENSGRVASCVGCMLVVIPCQHPHSRLFPLSQFPNGSFSQGWAIPLCGDFLPERSVIRHFPSSGCGSSTGES